MEFLQRKIKSEKAEDQNNMNISLINGIRLSCRWAEEEKPEKDVVINFTISETKKIIKLLRLNNDNY